MRTFTLALLLLTAGASPSEPHEYDALADQIESKVELPEGARPLSTYGRNYAFRGNNEVVGVYMLPFLVFDGSMNCVNGAGNPCPKKALDRLKQESAARQAAQASPGTRRWFASERELPVIMHGGCTRITVVYNIVVESVRAFCNG